MDLVLRPWRHYADFVGRSRRTEYFLFFIVLYGGIFFFLGLFFGLFGLPGPTAQGSGPSTLQNIVIGGVGLLLLASIIPSWAVTIRRLHDQDKAGWFAVLTFIPYIGPLIMLVFAFLPGTPGENGYGLDPRDDPAEDSERLGDVFS